MSFRGSCLCGSIEYFLDGHLVTYACHCTNCQIRTGSAFSMVMVASETALTMSGPSVEENKISESGASKTQYRCESCRTHVYSKGTDLPNLIKVQFGTLKDAKALAPEAHLWVRSAQQWFALPEEVPKFNTAPEDPKEILHAVFKLREQRKAGAT